MPGRGASSRPACRQIDAIDESVKITSLMPVACMLQGFGGCTTLPMIPAIASWSQMVRCS
jgi:hypothetical protein